jgi:hypothetical protein
MLVSSTVQNHCIAGTPPAGQVAQNGHRSCPTCALTRFTVAAASPAFIYIEFVSASVHVVLACSEEELQPRLLPSDDIFGTNRCSV